MPVPYNITEFAKACGGVLKQGANESMVKFLLTDSRKLTFAKETAFFALSSSRNDGHKYISELYQKGVRTFVISKPRQVLFKDANVIVVKDVLASFQNLAEYHRNKFNYPVLAITGSNGKTLVKEWLFQLLHEDFQIVRSPKSFNSQIGVPLSLWNLDQEHQLAIIEAGISIPDEMEKLEKMIRPTMGLITNLGEAHGEGFEDDTHKLKEKLKLFENCNRLFYCKDQKLVSKEVENLDKKIKRVSWSKNSKVDLKVESINREPDWAEIKGLYKEQQVQICIPFSDDASVENAIHCWLICLNLGIKPSVLEARFRKLQSVDIRLNMSRGIHDSIVISDYYNSDPESVRIAVNHLVHQKSKGKKIVILSSFEQLKYDPNRYRNVIKLIFQYDIDILVAIGNEWKDTFDHENRIRWFHDTKEFLPFLFNLPLQNSVILLKGARSFEFEQIGDLLKEKLHTTYLEVNLNSLVHNLNYFQSKLQADVKIMAMVKAFSYGSGSIEIANVLQYNHVDYLGVAYLEEGVELRKSGITLPIMVMNPEKSGFEKMIQYKLEPEIYSLELLSDYIDVVKEQEGREFPIHIKIDSGMNRLGLNSSDVNLLSIIMSRENRIVVKSAFSHLASADEPSDDEFTKAQILKFEKLAKELELNIGYTFDRHILNSAGILRFPESCFEMVRLGIGLYGVDSSNECQDQLEPVTQLKTHISQIREIEKGESVGYGRSYVASKNRQIAILPIGYADGYFRILSNGRGKVLVNGELCPIVGKVCMDMCMIDVTDISVHVGDEVEIFGKNLPVSQVAEYAETIPYELLAHVASRVPRVYSNAQ